MTSKGTKYEEKLCEDHIKRQQKGTTNTVITFSIKREACPLLCDLSNVQSRTKSETITPTLFASNVKITGFVTFSKKKLHYFSIYSSVVKKCNNGTQPQQELYLSPVKRGVELIDFTP